MDVEYRKLSQVALLFVTLQILEVKFKPRPEPDFAFDRCRIL